MGAPSKFYMESNPAQPTQTREPAKLQVVIEAVNEAGKAVVLTGDQPGGPLLVTIGELTVAVDRRQFILAVEIYAG